MPHSRRPARSLFKEKRETGRPSQPTGGARNSRHKALDLALRRADGASMHVLGQHLGLLTHANWLRQLATPTQTQEILQ